MQSKAQTVDAYREEVPADRLAALQEIRRHGQMACELRGAKAEAFLKKIGAASFSQAQQIMARATGNYKRGNERTARDRAQE